MKAYEFLTERMDLFGVYSPSIQELAKKHNISVKQLKKQLEMGIAVEYEHTKDKKIAIEIALDHLSEMPDYYTKLATIEPEHFQESILKEKKSSYEVLKANKQSLTDEERKKVMDAGATWRRSGLKSKSPAVWKSKDSSGKTKYVCNTHRMYQVRDTLPAAIKAYEIVKQSA